VSFAEYSLFYRALFSKEANNFKEPTNRSHPMADKSELYISQNRPIYAVATISRLLNIKGLICKRAL